MNRSTSRTQADLALCLSDRYQQVRQLSEQICQPLVIEDYVIQTMPDVSPPKWHLAHTTWFFETFLLTPHLKDYEVFHPQYGYLFNSYYEAVGQRHPRPQRGLLSRPTVEEVYRYRFYVDQAMQRLISEYQGHVEVESLITLGLHHEQQHQELLFTDLKHILASNPLRPAYRDTENSQASPHKTLNQSSSIRVEQWLDYPGGLYSIGFAGDDSNANPFSFDNESPQHQVYLQDYYLAARQVTNGEYLEFIQAGGYKNSEYWLSEGWTMIHQEQWDAPLYWEAIDDSWWSMTLAGMQPLNLNEPVCHVSFFEADAFARWAGKRLPTEAEWEVAAAQVPLQGNLLPTDLSTAPLRPVAARGITRPDQLYGDVWEWTQSAYLPYPGFKTSAGAIGEYNGKFMCNQMVLRGGSCVTPTDHIRSTYRNFFPPSTRWQFAGIRLAQ